MRYPPRVRDRAMVTNSGSGPRRFSIVRCTKLASVVLFPSRPPRASTPACGLPQVIRSHERKHPPRRMGVVSPSSNLATVATARSDLMEDWAERLPPRHCSALFANRQGGAASAQRGVQRFDPHTKAWFAWGHDRQCRIPQLQSPELLFVKDQDVLPSAPAQ